MLFKHFLIYDPLLVKVIIINFAFCDISIKRV